MGTCAGLYEQPSRPVGLLRRRRRLVEQDQQRRVAARTCRRPGQRLVATTAGAPGVGDVRAIATAALPACEFLRADIALRGAGFLPAHRACAGGDADEG